MIEAPTQPSMGSRARMNERPRKGVDPLFKHVGGLADFSSALIVLAELAPDRMTMSQGVFFLLAAASDLAGKPATFTSIKEAAGPQINRSLHTTYKVLLDGSRRPENSRQQGLNWLRREENPADNREKLLRLTSKGRDVIREVLAALTNEDL